MGVVVDVKKCTGCGSCVAACPFGVITLVDGKAQVGEGCTLCCACADTCAEAISIEAAPASTPAPAVTGYQGVWVFAEQHGGSIKGVTYELLSKGRQLADTLKTELAAVCLGHGVDTGQLAAYGADKVYLIDEPTLAQNKEDRYASALVKLIREHRPEIFLAGATSLGRSLIPRVAAVLKTGLTADCTGLDIDEGKRLLLQTRPTFGGNVMATIICPARRPQMATVRPRVFKKSSQGGRQAEIIKVDFKQEGVTSRTRLLAFTEELARSIKLEDADIIVSGGRGLGKAENFALLEELARTLGAAVGSSRPPVDDGWIPYPHQVGQTGKTVCPRLYIACGISGSVQHLAGMQTSECIVAINNDPNAPIFQVSTYGIVGDLFKVVPLMIEKLKSS